MTNWNPQPTITVNGSDLKDITLWGVQISFGRTNVWEQARASHASITIVNLTNTDYGFDMNQVVSIKVKNSASVDVTLFTGKITSVDNGIAGSGTTATVATQTLTAVGVFADMSRKLIGGTAWAKEFEDARMTRIFTDAGVTVDTVDTPPIYEFMAVTPAVNDAYTYAALYAGQAFGYIYETADYKVGYANESRRFVDARDNGYLNIPSNYMLWSSIASQKTLSDIANSIQVSWRAGIEYADDLTSQATYGIIAGSVTTELHNQADAILQADRYIELRAYPRTSLSAFTVQVDSPDVSDANRDLLLNMTTSQPIQIDSLPIAIKNTTYRGFVEGYSIAFNQYQMTMTLNTSDYTYSATPTRWQDVQATLIWNGVAPTLDWINYG